MASISILSNLVADKIAAGEVAERPMSVVKELVENSIDAGSNKITVEIKNGGISYISVCDNGCGIPSDELEIAFMRHATSKLREVEDLEKIFTMGFRGEALASICAVSDVEVITKTKESKEGAFIKLSHGQIAERDVIACNTGTIMTVKNLFSNVPARMKFLKRDSTEAGYVSDILSRIAMAHPEISFKFISDDKEIFSTSGDGNLKNVILKIYGLEYAKSVLDLNFSENEITFSGVIGKPEISRGNRTHQTVFVNGRYIKNHVISKIVEDAYRNAMMKGKFPFFVLNISIPPSLVDVNVHPAKTEVKFANEQRLYETLHRAVKNALYSNGKPVMMTDNAAALGLRHNQDSINGYNADRAYNNSDKPDLEFNLKSKPAPQYKLNIGSLAQSKRVENLNSIQKKSASEFLSNSSEFTSKSDKESSNPKASENSTFDFILDENEYKTDNLIVEDINTDDDEKIIGQLFNTYIIIEENDEMCLIDQHAAHERFRFEDLLRRYNERMSIGQMLLVPVVMNLTVSETEIISKNSERFSRLGFEIDDFGNNSIIIRQTPVELADSDIKNLITELIEAFSQKRNCDITDVELHALETISCKYAIKANKPLSLREMQDVINKLKTLNERGITTCPHGRPIKISVSKKEIEKMFKRIV